MLENYWNELNIHILKEKIQTWLGVPYRHMGNSVGGVDCVKLIGRIYKELGILTDYEDGVYYSKDWWTHSNVELVDNTFINHSAYLASNLALSRYVVDEDFEYVCGDCVLFKIFVSGMTNHTGIFFTGFAGESDTILHGAEKQGVHYMQFLPIWKKRAKIVYRLKKEAV